MFALVAAIAIIAITYAWSLLTGAAPAWAPWAMAPAIGAAMVGATVLGVGGRGQGVGWKLWAAFAITFLLITGGFVLALGLDGEGEPLVLGLPRRAAIVLYGVGLLPLLVLPVAYALTFDDASLSEDELLRLRDTASSVAAERPEIR